MSTSTNGIATQGNLYSLNSAAFSSWSGGLKCPTKAQIVSACNSNYTVNFAATYGNNQLVKYTDVSVVENGYVVDVTINVTFQPVDGNDLGRSAQLTVQQVGQTLKQILECYNTTENTTSTTHGTLTLKKNTSYSFFLKGLNGYTTNGTFEIGGVIGSIGVEKLGVPYWSAGVSPTGTIDIS